MIYILVDVGSKENPIVAFTKDKIKADNWKELLDLQGKDITICILREQDFSELRDLLE